GNGTYTTPKGYLPNATGTYNWVVVYGGDGNNNPITSPFGSEPWTVGTQVPTIITTTPSVTAVTLGTSLVTLKDTATLQDGISPAALAINTRSAGRVMLGSGTKLTDSAALSGGSYETVTITFKLYDPSNNLVDTETVMVHGNGTYTTPTGYLPTAAGTYQWV